MKDEFTEVNEELHKWIEECPYSLCSFLSDDGNIADWTNDIIESREGERADRAYDEYKERDI